MILPKLVLISVPIFILVDAQYNAQAESERSVPIRGPIVSRSRWNGPKSVPASVSNIPNESNKTADPNPTQPTEVSTDPEPTNKKIKLQNYKCKRENGYEAIPNKCDRYVECKDNEAYEAECLSGLHFDSTYEYPRFPCNYPSEAKCENKSREAEEEASNPTTAAVADNDPTTEASDSSTTEQSIEKTKLQSYKCKRENGYEAVPDNCDHYVECKKNIAYETKCSSGLHFDATYEYPRFPCNYPAQAKCGNQSVADESPTTEASNPTTAEVTDSNPTTDTSNSIITEPSIEKSKMQNYKCKHENGYEAVPDKCDYYIECKNKTAYETKCLAGLHFDATYEYPRFPCNYASQAKCGSQSSAEETPSTEAPNPTTVAETATTEKEETPSTQAPNPTTVDETVTTENNPTTEASNSATTELAIEKTKLQSYKCKRENGYEAVPNKCDYYMECKNNTAYETKCLAGLHFDATYEYPRFPCNYASQAKCGSQSSAEETPSTEAPNPTTVAKTATTENNLTTEASNSENNLTTEASNSETTEPANEKTKEETRSTEASNPTTFAETATTENSPTTEASNSAKTEPSIQETKEQNYKCKNENGYEAVPGKCDHYVECKNNTAYETKCLSGLHFDVTYKYPGFPCNYPKQAKCGNQSIAEETSSTEAPNPSTLAETATKESNLTTEASNSETTEPAIEKTKEETSSTEAPNPTTVAESVTTESNPTTEASSSTMNEPSIQKTKLQNYNCKNENGYEAVSDKCDHYVECKNNTASQKKCVGGLHFNAANKYPSFPCDYPSVVKCKSQSGSDVKNGEGTVPSTATPNPIPSNSKIPLEKYNCKKKNGYEAVKDKCNYYVECKNNQAYQTKCSDGLYFNDAIQFPLKPCSKPSQVKCQNEATEPRTNQSEVCTSRNMYAKIDGQCDSYVECRDYQAVNTQCPDGLHFNPNATWPAYPCEYPQYVQCTGRGATQPAIPTDDCTHQYEYKLSPKAISNDCGHYRVCVAGKAVEMYCPKGLAFNADKGICDWPSEVPSCNADAYIGFKCPPASFSKGVGVITNHKYDGDCNAFYSCMNGQARILACDPGFSFNAATGHCEDSSHVDCGSRPIGKD